MRILSIDAWADCCGCECEEGNPHCWTWNNWHFIGKTEKLPETVEEFFKVLAEAGYVDLETALKRASEFDIDDDQYNVVLIEKENSRPLYAVEYGNTEVA